MMSQSNLDYLFQVTAPLVDRPPSTVGSGRLDQDDFDDHLAQASGPKAGAPSPVEVRERPAPSSPLEQDVGTTEVAPSADESPATEIPPQEYGECAEAAQPAACGDEASEPTSEEGAQETAEAEFANEPIPTGDIASQNEDESKKEREDDEGLANAAVILTDLDDNSTIALVPFQTTLPEISAEIVESHSAGQNASSSTNESEAQHEAVEPVAPAQDGAILAAEPPTGARTLDRTLNAVVLSESSVRDANVMPNSPTLEPELNTTVDGAAVSNGELRDNSPAAQREALPVHDSTTSASPVSSPSTVAGTADLETNVVAANVAARVSEKTQPVEEPRRRSNDRSGPRAAPRNDVAASVTPVPNNLLVNNTRVDGASPPVAIGSSDDQAAKSENARGAKADVVLNPLARAANRALGVNGRASRADHENSLPRVDATRFVGRVAKAIQTANGRGGALQLRLSPPELGSLRLQLSVHDGVMTASLEAESPAARQLLLDHLPSLRERLAEQNIRIDRFDVDVRQEGSRGQADSRASQQDQRQQQSQQPASKPHTARVPHGDNSTRETMLHSRIAKDGLNVLA
jgi:flagellar hook-length control protein FliK